MYSRVKVKSSKSNKSNNSNKQNHGSHSSKSLKLPISTKQQDAKSKTNLPPTPSNLSVKVSFLKLFPFLRQDSKTDLFQSNTVVHEQRMSKNKSILKHQSSKSKKSHKTLVSDVNPKVVKGSTATLAKPSDVAGVQTILKPTKLKTKIPALRKIMRLIGNQFDMAVLLEYVANVRRHKHRDVTHHYQHDHVIDTSFPNNMTQSLTDVSNITESVGEVSQSEVSQSELNSYSDLNEHLSSSLQQSMDSTEHITKEPAIWGLAVSARSQADIQDQVPNIQEFSNPKAEKRAVVTSMKLRQRREEVSSSENYSSNSHEVITSNKLRQRRQEVADSGHVHPERQEVVVSDKLRQRRQEVVDSSHVHPERQEVVVSDKLRQRRQEVADSGHVHPERQEVVVSDKLRQRRQEVVDSSHVHPERQEVVVSNELRQRRQGILSSSYSEKNDQSHLGAQYLRKQQAPRKQEILHSAVSKSQLEVSPLSKLRLDKEEILMSNLAIAQVRKQEILHSAVSKSQLEVSPLSKLRLDKEEILMSNLSIAPVIKLQGKQQQILTLDKLSSRKHDQALFSDQIDSKKQEQVSSSNKLSSRKIAPFTDTETDDDLEAESFSVEEAPEQIIRMEEDNDIRPQLVLDWKSEEMRGASVQERLATGIYSVIPLQGSIDQTTVSPQQSSVVALIPQQRGSEVRCVTSLSVRSSQQQLASQILLPNVSSDESDSDSEEEKLSLNEKACSEVLYSQSKNIVASHASADPLPQKKKKAKKTKSVKKFASRVFSKILRKNKA